MDTAAPHHNHRAELAEDVRAHPRENALAALALVLGIVSVATALDRDLHLAGAVTGLLGVVIGLYDQYVSATTAERMVIVPAIVLSALGLGLALAHGGFGI